MSEEEELAKQFRKICQVQLKSALDERNPDPYQAAQMYPLSQILEKLEDIYATVANIEEKIHAE